MDEGDSKVGYRRPPVATRFKKGESGNPSGKRASPKSLAQRLDRILGEKIQVTEGGKSKRMDKEEVFLRKMVTSAIGGERQSARLLLDYLVRRQVSVPVEDTNATDAFLVGELEKFINSESAK